MSEDLEPGQLRECPFCGADARPYDADDGGSAIECSRCQASTALHYDRKENLYSSWNDRAAAPDTPLELTDSDIADPATRQSRLAELEFERATDTGMRQALEDAHRWRAFCECAGFRLGGYNVRGDEYFTCDVRIPNLDYRDYDSFTKAIDAYIARSAALSRPPHVADTREGEAHRVTVKTAGTFRIVGDDEDTTGAVVLFPDGPPTFPISVIWDREVMTLSRALASGADEKGSG